MKITTQQLIAHKPVGINLNMYMYSLVSELTGLMLFIVVVVRSVV